MSNNKKIALFSNIDSLCGAEQVLFRIARYYAEKENQTVKIYFFKPQTNNYWRENLPDNVELIYLSGSISLLIRLLRKERFDIVFSTHLMMNAILGFLRTIGILQTNKFITRESTQVFGRFSGLKLFQYKSAYFSGYRAIDLIICQTERMKKELLKNLPYLSKRTTIEVIPNPFDFPEEAILNEKTEVKENAIVSAGRLIPEKGFDILIQSFSELLKIRPEMHLMILGEGDELEKLEQLITALNLDDKVTLTGQVPNVYPYFRKAKLCVVSSVREGFPNVLLQMMSQNEKVVSTDCAGGIKQLAGVEVCETENPEALTKAMLKALNNENSRQNRLLFDKELNTRSVKGFINTVEEYLEL